MELHMTVGEMTAKMGVAEFIRWQWFLEKRARQQSGEHDPVEMDPEQLAAAFGAEVAGDK
jgi:hypothetical protein